MTYATTRFGLLAMLVLFAAPAWAQSYEITFQVDMNTAIENCAFTPGEGTVTVPGNFNGWDNTAFPLADGDGNGVYGGTFTINEADLVDDEGNPTGLMAYKFYATDPVGWEDDPNREFDPTEDTTLPVAEFNKSFENICDSETAQYEVVFQVDMSVQELIGAFDPTTDVVLVSGENINGWSNTADTLTQNVTDPDIYFGLVETEFIVPSTQPYKYLFGEEGTDAGNFGWESGDNRTFEVTGEETDSNDNGLLEIILEPRFFDGISPDDILSEEATVTFEVDLRPAYYHLADSTLLPSDTQTGEPTTSIDGLFINGPVAGSADGLADWATWGEEDLGAIGSRELVDDGSGDDAVAGDSIFTITYTYDPGTPRLRIGKFGINGLDNEGGFGADHNFRIDPGTQEIELAFGAILRNDGTYDDNAGPVINDQDFSNAYDPYILIDNEATPPTFEVVRRGGVEETVAVEPTGAVPTEVVLRGNYPNPFVGSTTFEYGVEESGHVHLAVYDLAGRRVAVLVDEVQTADTYRVTFDAADLASGVYVTQLRAGGTVLSQKLTVLN